MVEAQHVSEFVHNDRPHRSCAVRAGGGDTGKVRCVETHLAGGEDQRHQRLPGCRCVAASAEPGDVPGKAGSFRRSRPCDQHRRPALPVTVRLECLPVIAGSLCRRSVINKLQAGCLRSCRYGFPDKDVSTCRCVVWPDHVMNGAAGIVRNQGLVGSGRFLQYKGGGTRAYRRGTQRRGSGLKSRWRHFRSGEIGCREGKDHTVEKRGCEVQANNDGDPEGGPEPHRPAGRTWALPVPPAGFPPMHRCGGRTAPRFRRPGLAKGLINGPLGDSSAGGTPNHRRCGYIGHIRPRIAVLPQTGHRHPLKRCRPPMGNPISVAARCTALAL